MIQVPGQLGPGHHIATDSKGNIYIAQTAAAIGTITGAVIVLGKRSITDLPTILLAVTTVALLWKFKKIPEPAIVAAAALIGLAVYPLIHS